MRKPRSTPRDAKNTKQTTVVYRFYRGLFMDLKSSSQSSSPKKIEHPLVTHQALKKNHSQRRNSSRLSASRPPSPAHPARCPSTPWPTAMNGQRARWAQTLKAFGKGIYHIYYIPAPSNYQWFQFLVVCLKKRYEASKNLLLEGAGIGLGILSIYMSNTRKQ